MRQPSGAWETVFYYVGLALFGDMERTTVLIVSAFLLCLAGANREPSSRRERRWYALSGLCMAVAAFLHSAQHLLAGAGMGVASVLLALGAAESHRERRSPKAQ